MVVSYQLTFLFSTYLKSSFRLRHWFFHVSLLCVDKKENICEIHLPVSAFCLRDVCVCLSETGVFFLCTSKLWWMQCFLRALGSHHRLASCRVGQIWLFWEFYLASQFTLHFCPTWFCVWRLHCFSIAPEIFFQGTDLPPTDSAVGVSCVWASAGHDGVLRPRPW